MRKEEKGITLIALIITIIVLLILAGISMATLTGENGILKKADKARETTNEAGAKEKVQIAVMGSFGTERKIDIDTLNQQLNKVEGIDKENSNLPIENLPASVIVDHYNVKIEENGVVTIEGEKRETLPSTADTKPFLPEGAEKIEDTDLDTGLVIKDKNENEWVWVEVPKSIYTNTAYNAGSAPTSSEDYGKIESVMQSYASAYRKSGYSDTFYSVGQHGFESATEYNNHKNAMLKSVYEKGGFYVGRYETGTATPRFSALDTLETPVIQRDAYPYTFITCSQSQSKAKEISTGGKQASLLFGIQWDLILKYIEVKGAKTPSELKTNSSSWGNYSNITFEITRGQYSTAPSTSGSWKLVSEIERYVKPASAVLLTTGATEKNSVLEIYDLAGNLYEWTLEKTPDTQKPCTFRGGFYFYTGSGSPASSRYNYAISHNGDGVGFRVTLW